MERRGIEPRFAECDSAVIPLDHRPGRPRKIADVDHARKRLEVRGCGPVVAPGAQTCDVKLEELYRAGSVPCRAILMSHVVKFHESCFRKISRPIPRPADHAENPIPCCGVAADVSSPAAVEPKLEKQVVCRGGHRNAVTDRRRVDGACVHPAPATPFAIIPEPLRHPFRSRSTSGYTLALPRQILAFPWASACLARENRCDGRSHNLVCDVLFEGRLHSLRTSEHHILLRSACPNSGLPNRTPRRCQERVAG